VGRDIAAEESGKLIVCSPVSELVCHLRKSNTGSRRNRASLLVNRIHMHRGRRSVGWGVACTSLAARSASESTDVGIELVDGSETSRSRACAARIRRASSLASLVSSTLLACNTAAAPPMQESLLANRSCHSFPRKRLSLADTLSGSFGFSFTPVCFTLDQLFHLSHSSRMCCRSCWPKTI
jgi:hypothetical protein